MAKKKCKLIKYLKTKDHRSRQLKRGWKLRHDEIKRTTQQCNIEQ